MPSHARCAVGYCDNDRRYPDLYVKRSHVEDLRFHKWPKDEQSAEIWRKQILKSRQDDFNPKPGASGTYVCSNHFPLGRRTPNHPENDYPSLIPTLSDYQHQTSQVKRMNIVTCTTEHDEPEEPEHEMPDQEESH